VIKILRWNEEMTYVNGYMWIFFGYETTFESGRDK